MLRSLLRVGILAVAFSLLTGPVSAHPTPDKTLEEAFNSYCRNLSGQKPADCQSGANVSPARQYLILEEVCAKNSSDAHCQTFEQAKNADPTLEPLVLVLNHETGRWAAGNRLADQAQARIKYDVAGQPTVSLARKERIVVVVDNTNPLLYGAVPGKPTEESVPELQTIQKLLSTLGGGIAGLLKTFPEVSIRVTAGEPELQQYLKDLEDYTQQLETLVDTTRCRTDQVAVQTSRAVSFIQELEFGNKAIYVLTPLQCTSSTPTSVIDIQDVSQAFLSLQTHVLSLDRLEGCTALLDASRNVYLADPADPSKVRAALDAFDDVDLSSCPVGQELKAEQDDLLGEVRDRLQEAADATIDMRAHAAKLKQLEGLKTPTSEQKAHLKELQEEKAKAQKEEERRLKAMRVELKDIRGMAAVLLDAIQLSQSLTKIRTDAEAILAKRDDVHKAAAQVQVFEERLERVRRGPIEQCPSGNSTVDCVKSTSLDLRFILEPQLKGVRQTKLQKHSVTVKPDSPYAAKVVATRPAEVKGEYVLDSVLRGLWGISASVTYTDLTSPTFGAVTSEDDPDQMVIAMTDETTRAGDIALLADFRLGRWLACHKNYSNCKPKRYNWFGVELGAGVSDEPAFFAGISLRPSRSWRIGFGYTYQQVKELQNGFELGQVVASADDIQVRDTFEGDWYVSLSFALDSLRLFSAGD